MPSKFQPIVLLNKYRPPNQCYTFNVPTRATYHVHAFRTAPEDTMMVAGAPFAAMFSSTARAALRVSADVTVVPLGTPTASLSGYVARCIKIFRDPDRNLNPRTHAYGTNIEGDIDDVMAAIKDAHTLLHDELDVARVNTVIKMGSRVDQDGYSMDYKLRRIGEQLGDDPKE